MGCESGGWRASAVDVHRGVPRHLDEVLSWEEERVVQSDWTVACGGKRYQLDRQHEALSLVRRKVIVRTLRSGRVQLVHRSQQLKWRSRPAGAVRTAGPVKAKPTKPLKTKAEKAPAANHPWRRFGGAAGRVATSRNLVQWTKQAGLPLLLLKRDVPDVGTYDSFANWRDPHVFWNPQAAEWWLAIAAHEKTEPAYPYAGAVALATSKDLRSWKVRREPSLATREIVASECPDVFPLGSGWAMVYYADTTRIRLADTPGGPWRRPVNDAPWGLHFQGGKTESDGQRRIIHAYLERSASDFAEHVFGGCMALPREVFLDEHGAVATRLVPEVIAACREDATNGKGAQVFMPGKDDPVGIGQNTVALSAKLGATALALWKDAPADFFLTADVKLARGATLNLLLRGKEQKNPSARVSASPLDDSYVLSLDAHARQVTLTRQNAWNRMPARRVEPLDLPDDRSFKLHVMLHGNVLEVFVDDRISLCAGVQSSAGALAILARDGQVSLNNVGIRKLP